jgi:glycosyltransferase involved in cell wall biosynthesis
VGAYFDLGPGVAVSRGLLADNNCVIAQRTNPGYRVSHRLHERQFAYERRVYRSMDRVFCFSSMLAQSMVGDFGCDAGRVEVVHAGINLSEDTLTEPDKRYDTRTILFSGFNWELKGGPVLLEAFARVRQAEPAARLEIVGPSLSGLPPGVTCHGPLSKDNPAHVELLGRLHRTASVFVLPTLADAFPNVIREAMAARLPCVASRVGGIPDMIVPGQTGALVPPADADALARELIALIRDPELARRQGEAGYAIYREGFTWEAVCTRIIARLSEPPAVRRTDDPA